MPKAVTAPKKGVPRGRPVRESGSPGTVVMQARVPEVLRDRSLAALEAIGLNFSTYVKMSLAQLVARQALPFEARVPNARTRAAIDDLDQRRDLRRLTGTTAEIMQAMLDEPVDAEEAPG